MPWFVTERCKICSSQLVTDGERFWCINECEIPKNIQDGLMVYGKWIEEEEDEE